MRHVAEALSAKMVMVTEASDPEGRHVRMLAGWYDGAPIDREVAYETRGQPCALVPGESVVAYPEELAKHFPEDQAAIEMGLESYLAVCLRDSQGTYLGHLAVLDTRRMEAGQEDVAALRIFAARAGAELERRNQAKALAASRARIIGAADAERRRFGRDLHDGAQQRLLAVSNLLRVARKKATGADELLAMAQDELPPPTPSCASWRAGCTRSRSPTAGCLPRSSRSRPRRRCRSRSRCARSRCRTGWRPPRTSSSPSA